MGLDLWFPLAVHHEDLPLDADVLRELAAAVRRIDPTDSPTAWTGDVEGHDALHHDPAFADLTAAVARGVWSYLAEVGHRVDELDLLVQRAWPVVAGAGQTVAPHAHPMAHLSAVVHLDAATGSGGELKFLNTAAPNELAVAAGGGTATDAGPLTFGGVVYEPVPGRLFVFPAKQRHEVLPHHGPATRVSVAYDLVVTSRWDRPGGVHEFVMPPPERWLRMPRPQAPAPVGTVTSFDLASLSRLPDRPRHAFPDPTGHLLYDVTIEHDAVPGPDSTGNGLDSDTVTETFRAAVDAVDTLLAARGVATIGATVGAPTLVGGTDAAVTERSGSDLVAWVGLATPDPVVVEVVEEGDDGSDKVRRPYAVPPRAVLLVGGYRASRVVGGGPSLRVPLDLPALARPGFAVAGRLSARADLECFLAATALPLQAAAPSADEVVAAAAAHRRRLAARGLHELSARLLDRGEGLAASDPSGANGDSPKGEGDSSEAAPAYREYRVAFDDERPVLDVAECERLIDHARAHLAASRPDSVDGRAEYQVDLGLDELRDIVGDDATDRLCAAAPPGVAPESLFVRHFSTRTRPFIPFHHDESAWTLNVPLEDPARTTGGELIVLGERGPRVVERRRGCAIGHSGALVHGVRRMTAGDRWSLIALCAPTAPPSVR